MLATSVTIGHDLVNRDLNGMFYIEAIDELKNYPIYGGSLVTMQIKKS